MVGMSRPVVSCNIDMLYWTSFQYTCERPAAGARSRRPMDLLGFTYTCVCFSVVLLMPTNTKQGCPRYYCLFDGRTGLHAAHFVKGVYSISRSRCSACSTRDLLLSLLLLLLLLMPMMVVIAVKTCWQPRLVDVPRARGCRYMFI